MNAAITIARHLKVNHWQVTRVEEWARVFFVVVKGLGARFVSKKINKMNDVTPVYEGIFGQLQFDSKHVDLASTQALTSKDGHKFLKQHFKPGDLLETKNGIQMLDKNYNAMKAGYHEENPDRAKQLAGLSQ